MSIDWEKVKSNAKDTDDKQHAEMRADTEKLRAASDEMAGAAGA